MYCGYYENDGKKWFSLSIDATDEGLDVMETLREMLVKKTREAAKAGDMDKAIAFADDLLVLGRGFAEMRRGVK